MANCYDDKVAAEHISSLPDRNGRVFRIPAPGGWIVVCSSVCVDDKGNGTSMAMTFVPDEGHRWLGQEDDNE